MRDTNSNSFYYFKSVCVMLRRITELMYCLFCFLFFFSFGLVRAQTDNYSKYIEKYKTLAIEQMYKYGVPASITLSQGLLESGAGRSLLAVKANNHFGIKAGISWTGPFILKDDDAVGEKFRVYKHVIDSYEDHSIFLTSNRRYASLFKLKRNDYKGWAHGLKSAGYATNPRYALLLIDLIEKYNLQRFDHFSRHAASDFISDNNVTIGKIENISKTEERSVYRCNNSFYIVAQKGDTYATISKWSGISERRLRKYNELPRKTVLKTGDVVYLEKKHKRAASKLKNTYYVVKDGDSFHSIAQKYGIRIKSLYKNNMLKYTDTLKVGQRIKIR